jgi:hypothetical protein
MVKEIYPGGSSPTWPEGLTAVNGRLFFSADDGTHGRDLWAAMAGLDEVTYLPVVMKAEN